MGINKAFLDDAERDLRSIVEDRRTSRISLPEWKARYTRDLNDHLSSLAHLGIDDVIINGCLYELTKAAALGIDLGAFSTKVIDLLSDAKKRQSLWKSYMKTLRISEAQLLNSHGDQWRNRYVGGLWSILRFINERELVSSEFSNRILAPFIRENSAAYLQARPLRPGPTEDNVRFEDALGALESGVRKDLKKTIAALQRIRHK